MSDEKTSAQITLHVDGDDHRDKRDKSEPGGIKLPRICCKWFFFLGFICPILWIIGSRLPLKDAISDQSFPWKKRCRIAVTIVLTLSIVGSVLALIFNPQAFGLRQNTSSGPQTSSNSNSALRPDVPVNGTSTTGDIVAGMIVAGP